MTQGFSTLLSVRLRRGPRAYTTMMPRLHGTARSGHRLCRFPPWYRFWRNLQWSHGTGQIREKGGADTCIRHSEHDYDSCREGQEKAHCIDVHPELCSDRPYTTDIPGTGSSATIGHLTARRTRQMIACEKQQLNLRSTSGVLYTYAHVEDVAMKKGIGSPEQTAHEVLRSYKSAKNVASIVRWLTGGNLKSACQIDLVSQSHMYNSTPMHA